MRRIVPDDPWIVGQQVYYLAASGDFDGALNAARDCRASASWCELLRGFVTQRSGHSIEAEATFATALAGLEAADRCRWTGVSMLLDSDGARAYSALPCGSPERAMFEERFWMLADPSWVVPGNDRRTEHLARMVEQELQRQWSDTMHADSLAGPATFATSPGALVLTGPNDSWWIESRPLYVLNQSPIPPGATLTRADSQRLALCAKQECYHEGWTQVSSRGTVECGLGTETVARTRLSATWGQLNSTGQECARLRSATARYHFAPTTHALQSPLAATADDWSLNAGPPIDEIDQPVLGKAEAPLPERYTPPYAAHVTGIPGWQVAYFRRGDSALVAGVFDVTGDSAFDHLLGVSSNPAKQTSSNAKWTAGLIASARPAGGTAPFRQTMARTVATLAARWAATIAAPWDSLLIGLELLTPADARHDGGVLGRERFGVTPPEEPRQRVQLSDILLYAPQGGLPTALLGTDGALARSLGSTVLGNRQAVGLYWEAYGEHALEMEHVTLIVVPVEREQGVIGEILSAVTRAGPGPPVALEWDKQAPPLDGRDSVASVGRAVSINIGGLQPGRYTVRLTVAVDGEAPVTVTRTFGVRTGPR
ncbi:MAG TPA: hypothetical protein VMH39_16390, partial [Gemmatimonadaceae bacterium]|nr:hypothetical protein [Gemmatimonadaceae bacterium]